MRKFDASLDKLERALEQREKIYAKSDESVHHKLATSLNNVGYEFKITEFL
jgi:hypothetical protein